MTDLCPNSFESAMSHLVAAVKALDEHWPTTQCQSSRLAEQVGRLDRTWAKSASAILHKGDVA